MMEGKTRDQTRANSGQVGKAPRLYLGPLSETSENFLCTACTAVKENITFVEKSYTKGTRSSLKDFNC